MRARDRWATIVALAACDAALLLLGTAIAFWLRFSAGGWPGPTEGGGVTLSFLLLGAALSLAVMAGGGLYRLDDLFAGHREYAGVARACTYAAFTVLLTAFLLDSQLSRGALVLWWACSAVSVACGRFVFRRAVFRIRRAGRLVRRALIVGCDEHAVAIARRLSAPASGWQVLGFLDDYHAIGTPVTNGLRVVGDPKHAVQLAAAYGASDLVLVPHAVSWEAQRDLLELAATRDQPALRLAPGFYHLLATGARPMEANFVPLLTLQRLRITGVDAALKKVIDVGASLAALPALGALAGALALAGGGPVIERQRALGLHARPFDLLVLAPPRGPRPDGGTRRWRLRDAAARSRLSKLPNVVNVLRGHMSLVGPRALPASAPLRDQPWTRTLLLVRPGLTGPHLPNSAWSAAEQSILDVAYVREYSLWLDLRLLVASVLRVLRRERALPAAYHAPAVEPARTEASTS
ncbi:MAG: sugar transferase [Chloroflexi bacterium]|nr:sugar transferase [Chloroflexota bacterium]